ncbi:homospermidine synthase [Stella sp.]|uniref:homospermidine synthase n=1 Tax=Stella sp. TaxID=2912054 RepID=UPI0035B4D74A
MKHVRFTGKIVMVGMGSIGQGVLPLIFRHIEVAPHQVTIVTADDRGRDVAAEYGVRFVEQPLTRENYADVLRPMLGVGDFLVNLSVEVSSIALIELCQEIGALYIDTCIEPWPGGYTDPSLSYSQRSNYGLRETALDLKRRSEGGPTAVITHGANPGIVSYFVKRALLDIARDTGVPATAPGDRAGWAELARRLDVKVIHIAERDTQVSLTPKRPGEFVNTWSIDGFVSEGCQPAELGWGTHERHFPADGARHENGCGAAIYLMRPGASTRVRTWTPLAGTIHGFLITHNESISIADYYTVKGEDGQALYRPTVHYAYHPCDDAVLSVHELAGRNWQQQERQRLMVDEVVSGIDELGVLLLGHARKAYWYGSRLTIDETRALVPHNNATSLQVTVGVLAGMVWAIENPRAGLVEADEIDHDRMFEIMTPYLGNLVGQYGDWTPLRDRGVLFPEEVDQHDPWQFKNFRVV